jgi:hypothetical protein
MAYASAAVARSTSSVSKRKLVCTHCFEEKEKDGFKWCTVCRIAGAVANRAFYWDHKKRRLCVRCIEAAHRTRTHGYYARCDDHRKRGNVYQNDMRQGRRSEGKCAWCAKPNLDTYLCESCLAIGRKSKQKQKGLLLPMKKKIPAPIRKAA